MGYVLPQPHGRRQMFLPKFRTVIRQVDMVKWGPELCTSAWRGTFNRRMDLQNKGLQRSNKNMNEEDKASICLSKARVSEREREREMKTQACCSCAECVMGCVEGLMESIFIVVERDY